MSKKDRDYGWATATVLPFMTRVHERVQQAGETLHIDGTFNVTNDPEVKLAWLMCGTPLGGMPLGASPSPSWRSTTRGTTSGPSVLPALPRRRVGQTICKS